MAICLRTPGFQPSSVLINFAKSHPSGHLQGSRAVKWKHLSAGVGFQLCLNRRSVARARN